MADDEAAEENGNGDRAPTTERWGSAQRNHLDELFHQYDDDPTTGMSYHEHYLTNDYLCQIFRNDPLF